MNANSISRPINQQSAQSWTPVLAAFLVAIALVIGVAGVAALTARTASTSPMALPRTLVDHPGKDEIAPALPAAAPKVLGYEWINGQPHAITAPVLVPQTINIDEQHAKPFFGPRYTTPVYEWLKGAPLRTQSLGVPFPGGVAGPSQLDRFVAPGMGGH